MSAKNRLQEFYQKQQKDLPIYTCINLGNQPHAPEWKASVKTVDGQIFHSDLFSKKTHAENDAAAKCLKVFDQLLAVPGPNLKKYTRPEVPKCIILMDLENVQAAVKLDLSNVVDTRILGFVGKYNRGILKDRERLESMMELIITDTVCDDAADHALTFYVGLIAGTAAANLKWIILSSDHFATVPIEFLQKHGFKDTWSVTNVDDLKKIINL